MPTKCYLCNGKPSSESYISLHKFPKNEVFREKWKAACGLIGEDVSHFALCSIHFKSEFVQMRKMRGKPIVTLVSTAIPTISVPNLIAVDDVIIDLNYANAVSKKPKLETPMELGMTVAQKENKASSANEYPLAGIENVHVSSLLDKRHYPELSLFPIELTSVSTAFNDKTTVLCDDLSKPFEDHVALSKPVSEIEDNEWDISLQQSVVKMTEFKNKETSEHNVSYSQLEIPQDKSSSELGNVNRDLADAMKLCKMVSRRSFDPRYVSEIEDRDFSTPRRRKRTIEMIKESDAQKSLKIKRLQDLNLKRKKRIQSLGDLIKHLQKERLLSCEAGSSIMSVVSDDEQSFIAKMLMKRKGKYSEEVRSFALTLYFYSPKSYNYVRSKWGKQFLPHSSTMRSWCQVIDGSPGFTQEALQAIRRRSEGNKNVVVNVVIDEICLRSQLIYEKNTGQYYGGIDIGNYTLSSGKRKTQTDVPILATHALVFMAVSLNESWKVAFGYFLIKSLDSQERANLLTLGLDALHSHNCQTFSITFDGASTNLGMCEVLGANFQYGPSFKPYFTNPITSDTCYVFLDMCHMFKLIRNTFGEWKVLKNGNGEFICWKFIEQLHELQKKEGVKVANKLTNKHIAFQNNKMNVKLAMQVMSLSVCNSLIFLTKMDDHDIQNQFKNCLPTAEFCMNMNNMADMLNCKNKFAKGEFNCPLNDDNLERLEKEAKNFENYLSSLTDQSGKPILKSIRKTGFLGMITCLRNIFPLYERLKNCGIDYLLTYKLCQDYLETFFSIIRGRGGWNNNPNVLQFKSSYKRVMVQHELKEFKNGNCLFDNIAILHVSSKHVKCPIGNSELLTTTITPFDHDYVASCFELSKLVSEVSSYIAGFVAKKLLSVVDCSVCKGKLLGDEMPLLSALKNRGPFVAPSKSIIYICKIAERVIRENMHDLHRKNLKNHIVNSILMNSQAAFSDEDMIRHILTNEVLDNHRSQLRRFVAECYVNIRLFSEGKKLSEKDVYLRAKYTKLILFKNE